MMNTKHYLDVKPLPKFQLEGGCDEKSWLCNVAVWINDDLFDLMNEREQEMVTEKISHLVHFLMTIHQVKQLEGK